VNTFLLLLWLATCTILAVFIFLKQRSDKAAFLAQQREKIAELESQEAIAQARGESQEAVNAAQRTLEQKLVEIS
jgi:hypothetical protein